jgi:hypothetical protein
MVKLSLQLAVEAHKFCETSRLPWFLENWFTDGGKGFALTRRPRFTPRKVLVRISFKGRVDRRAMVRL